MKVCVDGKSEYSPCYAVIGTGFFLFLFRIAFSFYRSKKGYTVFNGKKADLSDA